MNYKKSIFIFRRDLRLNDNSGLNRALELSQSVVPCFFFDNRQINDNPYFSENAFQFMLGSLEELDSELKKRGSGLFIFSGDPSLILRDLIKDEKIDAIFVNEDYTPFSKERDGALKKIAEKNSISFLSHFDLLLHDPRTVMKPDGSPYTVFTHFYKSACKKKISLPDSLARGNFWSHPIKSAEKKLPSRLNNTNLFCQGGRKNAISILSHLQKFKDYPEKRNFPAEEATTGLSAHNKFGTISPREFYYAILQKFGESHTLITELHWRDFFTYIAYHFPYVFKGAFRRQYDSLSWNENEPDFNRWCNGNTGFPIVDAGMRQLNATGFMHNRVRMVVSSFLVKDLHISWRKGEQYFASKLIDYDPCVNNGNWQWAASTGCDSQPYFRVFNPLLQQKRFDPEFRYIKKWVPELSDCRNQDMEKSIFPKTYPEPMVNHGIEREIAIDMFRRIR